MPVFSVSSIQRGIVAEQVLRALGYDTDQMGVFTNG
jgi:hypothetical protein